MRRPSRFRRLLWKNRAREARESISESARNRQRRGLEYVLSCDGSQWICAGEARQNCRHIQNENNGAIAEDGRTTDQVAGYDFCGERLNEQLFFSNEAINKETKTFFGRADDDDEMLFLNGLRIDAAQAAELVQTDQRENLVAETKDLTLVHAMDFMVRDARDFHDGGKRHREQAATHAEKQRLNAGEREWGAKLERRALAVFRGNLDGSLEAIEDGSNDVHTDSAARNFRDFRSGAQTCFKNKIESILLGESLSFFGFQKFGLDGACAEPARTKP